MYSSKDLRELINNRLGEINLIHKPKELYEPVGYVLSNGGKRLRPVLTLPLRRRFTAY